MKPGQVCLSVCLCVLWMNNLHGCYDTGRDTHRHMTQRLSLSLQTRRTRLQILNLSDPTKHIAINIDSPNTEYEAEGLTVTNVKIPSKVFRYASRNPVKKVADIGTNGAIPNCLSS